MDKREAIHLGLVDRFKIDDVPARKAAPVLEYLYGLRCGELPRINDIWLGMTDEGISFYHGDEGIVYYRGYDTIRISHEFENISIGLAVGLSRGLIGTCEWGTKYTISASGMDFVEDCCAKSVRVPIRTR